MYKTGTIWIMSKDGKLEFKSGNMKDGKAWISVNDNSSSGEVSFHFDADGLAQFIDALEILKKDMIEAKNKEVDNAKYK